MTFIIDSLIEFLTELRDMSAITQILTLAGIPAVVAFLFSLPTWKMTRKVRDSVTEYNALKARLNTAQAEAAKLKAQFDALEAETPDTFIANHTREMKDGNEERAMELSEEFVERQKEALLLAFHTRMDEAIRQSVEDGASAFSNARGWALAYLALSPRDTTVRMLADDLGDAAGIAETSCARVKLKDSADRQALSERAARLPMDIEALKIAFFNARDRGHYAVMLFLAKHGLMLTRRAPYGTGTQEHLLFRRHRVEALNVLGRSKEALEEATPLRKELRNFFGERHPEFFYAVLLLAKCQYDTGDAAGALDEVQELLPLRTEVQGARHPGVLATRYLLAQCQNATGDAAGTLAELQELLPLETEVQGARHPHVLSTRYLLAQCLNDTGDTTGALDEVQELLPLYSDVQGARHPHVLSTRYLLAQCLNDTGDATGALDEVQELLPLYSDVQGARHPHVLSTRYLLAQCLNDTGDATGALDEVQELLPLYSDVQGARHPHVLSTRYLLAQCLNDTGDATGALDEVQELLPLYSDVQGARHPHVLSTRYLLAQCLNDTGDAAGALDEVQELLPLYSDVQGARHPHVLSTRYLLAQCLNDTGDATGALAEVQELLPLRTEVLGTRHPHVLNTRILQASCLVQTGDKQAAKEALDGIRDGLVAAGLRPEHKYFSRLEDVENKLKDEGQ
ncbi:Anaphase-promoting complex, cyclosome, subunit 3 [Roseovarius albus]|uniref:Anaphase-promoting complex, cyclosome, subunit 3 n=1 Tax=Roseovarius albus TaxID=1247867 RepID=A0A1X6YYH8_9RHOB|nr:tetratricopeptide repeat protein [Roseovarius albus]SLN35028.1 Anaphase-promoting complex, cyclosome, subunit 3 [Roseovarius albus]